MPKGITVPEVCRSMRVEPKRELMWSIGARAREEYARLHGNPPPKALRQKTNGAGSHCFAVYPETMRQTIERIVREHNAATERQGSLF